MEGWSNLLIVILVFAALLFLSAVGALYWASKSGQLKNFEKGAKVVFTEEEPEGQVQDAFPGEIRDKENKENQGRA